MSNAKKRNPINRANYQGTRRFPGGIERSNDTWETGLNNNDLLIGPSGVGKTRSYVIPNILRSNESFVLADTKGTVYDQVVDDLLERGFAVEKIDFVNPENSTIGYNPLDYVRKSPDGKPNEQDIMKIASMIVSENDHRADPFWGIAARGAVASIIAFVLEAMPKSLQNMKTVAVLARCFDAECRDPEAGLEKIYHTVEGYIDRKAPMKRYQISNAEEEIEAAIKMVEQYSFSFKRLLRTYDSQHENSMGMRLYDLAVGNCEKAEKMAASISGIVGSELRYVTYDEIANVFAMENRLDFRRLGREKTAIFLTVSDTDRSVDRVVNMFYAQAFNILCESADNDYDGRHMLDIPVRIYLDDFATNVVIPDFDNLISVIRSREIYTSVVLQSLSQLDAIYGEAKASTILNNCSTCMYLGGRDIRTVAYVGHIADKTPNTIMNLQRGKYYLITAGEEAKLLDFTPGE